MRDGLIVRPGDTLILTFSTQLSRDQAARYKAEVMKRLPGLADVLFITGDNPTVSAYRPEVPDES